MLSAKLIAFPNRVKWVAYTEQTSDAIRLKQLIRNHTCNTPPHRLPAYDEWAINL